MFNLHIGSLKDELRSGDGYFDHWVDDDCLETDFARKVISGVDKCKVVSKYNILSPVLSSISPKMLSCSTKTLLTLMFSDEDKIVSLYAMGESCFKYLPEIAAVRNITLTMNSFISLYLYGFYWDIHILNDDSIVTDTMSLIQAYAKFR